MARYADLMLQLNQSRLSMSEYRRALLTVCWAASASLPRWVRALSRVLLWRLGVGVGLVRLVAVRSSMMPCIMGPAGLGGGLAGKLVFSGRLESRRSQ
ncbi:MAG TPA: hypothetical protein DDY14_06090, partial [Chromatiaceae bacterium]|nr:hypothetical protein [Chromatiaceae bacterium]